LDEYVLQRDTRRVPTPPPALPTELVRSRLLDDVNRRFQVPLTVIVAGAGFGKSTLLAQAIRANQADPRGLDTWLSCEPADCDAAHLASAVVTALGQASDRGEPIERILEAVGRLAPIDVCIVIDDVHEVPAQSTAAQLLAELVVRLPPHAHVVLAGRTPPPIPLDLRRAAGQVVDVGIEELAFTPTEVNALATSLGRDVRSDPAVAGFAGWPSLVRLALSAPEGSAPQFLWEEIVAGLSSPARRLLLALATLGWGTASDVAWVAGSGDGGSDPLVDARLDMIATDVPLVSGDADGWYRVHHLWEEAAERIVSDEDRAGMRRRALELFQRRRETLRTGWSALRWGDARVLGLACRELVHETVGALPVDTAARWLADAAESARATPDLRLLEVALRHARDFDDPRLDGELDAVVDNYLAGGDHPGAVVALILGMAIAHMRGDLPRLLAVDERARSLPGADDEPVLRSLRGAMRAMTASLEGDALAAVAAIEAMSMGDAPAPINQLVVRLLANMLGLCGRAEEAVSVSAVLLDSPSPYTRTLHAKARWLAGDPTGYPGGQFEAAVPPGTNGRYQLHHAMSGMAVATSFGNGKLIEELSSILDRWARTDVRDDAMLAYASAARHLADHDEAMAAKVIAALIDAQPATDRVVDGRLRRLLAVPYVCDERVRQRWAQADLGPSLIRQRDVADDLLAARAGTLSPHHQLASATVVLTTLPLVWSVELAARAVATGCTSGFTLVEGLAELAPEALRVELEHAAGGDDAVVRGGAEKLLEMLPDATHPPVRISVLGPLAVDANGQDVGAVAPDLRRKRVRSLLEILVLAGPLRRDRIGDLMWSDLDPCAAGRNVRVTLSRLRTVLEPGRPARPSSLALRIDNEVVALAPLPHVEVDLWQFRDDLAAADDADRRGDRVATIVHLERACGRWRGEPFVDIDHDELVGAVEEVRNVLADTALRLGELLLVAGRFDEAAAWAERVMRESPYDERAYRLAIAAHIQRRDRQATAQAVTATKAMLDDLGVEPEAPTQMLLRQAEDHIGRPPALAV
jgi:LuxR family transcriptional regulator, maltose regulon positive regulatory protein